MDQGLKYEGKGILGVTRGRGKRHTAALNTIEEQYLPSYVAATCSSASYL